MTQTSKAKVGILLRTKNRPLFLERALNKICQQTFSDWHIHLLNDGGETTPIKTLLERCNETVRHKISVTHNASSVGRGAALSQLLSIASEEYLLIHDDDDTIEPRFLETTVKFLDTPANSHCVSVVTSNFDVQEVVTPQGIVEVSRTEGAGKRSNGYISFLFFLSYYNGLFPPNSALFRHNALQGIDPKNYVGPYNEDVDLFIELLKKGEIATLSETLSSYCHRANPSEDDTTNHLNDLHVTQYMNNKVRNAISSHDQTDILRSIFNEDRRNYDVIQSLIRESHHDIISHVVESNKHIQNNIKLLAQILESINTKVSNVEKKIF